MKYFLLAGEASGDLHGSNLAKQIIQQDAAASLFGWGGNLMQTAGVNILKSLDSLAFMGFVEVLKNIRTIQKNFKDCKAQILECKPDVVIMIDYPGFNLRMAKWCKENNYKVAYYISPQVWAWKENRVQKIKQFVDEMICILPFEKEFYAKHEYPVHFVGHPLVQVIEEFKASNTKKENSNPIIALLPGSRVQEIQVKLPIMLSVVEHFPQYTFAIAKSPTLSREFYTPFLQQHKNIELQDKAYPLLHNATVALVTSGTATLETALFGVPQIVCYKGNAMSYWIGKQLIKVPFISLVNLIAGKAIVKELIQYELNTNTIKAELEQILSNTLYRNSMIEQYTILHQELGKDNASAKAASIIIELATNSTK
jgi:lipid-A-disaccharide synthase